MASVKSFILLSLVLAVVVFGCRRPETATPSEPAPVTTPLMPKAGEVRSFSTNGIVQQRDSALVILSEYPEFVFWVPVWYNPTVVIYPDRPDYRERIYSKDSIRTIFLETFGPISSNPDSARAELEVFVKWLNATGLTLDDAMDLLQQSGMSHEDVIQSMDDMLTAYANTQLKTPLVHFNYFLESRNFTWAMFNDAVRQAGTTPKDFWTKMASRNRGPDILGNQMHVLQDNTQIGLIKIIENVMLDRLFGNLRLDVSYPYSRFSLEHDLVSGGIVRSTGLTGGNPAGVVIERAIFNDPIVMELDYRWKQTSVINIAGEVYRTTPLLFRTPLKAAEGIRTIDITASNDLFWTDKALLNAKVFVYQEYDLVNRPLNASEKLIFREEASSIQYISLKLKVHCLMWITGQKAYGYEYTRQLPS